MRSQTRRLANRACVLSFALAWASLPAVAGADQILLKTSGSGKPFALQASVTRVENNQVFYRSSSGTESARPLSQVVQLTIDAEPMLNQAEAAFAAATPDWDTACTAYNAEIHATDKEWLRDYCRARLIDAAGHNGQVDLATEAYIHFVQTDAAMAAAHIPKIPDSGAHGLDQAAALLSNAVSSVEVTGDQKTQLLTLLLAVDKGLGDDKAAAKVTGLLSGIPASADADSTSGAPVRVSQAQTTLQQAKDARDKKNYADALKQINDNAAAFTDPASQVEALYVIAQCKEALAKSDDELKDAAIAYMRVYTHFKQATDVDFVPQSVLNTAHILERLKESKQAYDTYQIVVTNFQKSNWATEAQKECDRLRAGGLRID